MRMMMIYIDDDDVNESNISDEQNANDADGKRIKLKAQRLEVATTMKYYKHELADEDDDGLRGRFDSEY